jgi:site-specific DNA recombinase
MALALIRIARGIRPACGSTRRRPPWWPDALVWEDLCQLLTHPEALQFALERAHGEHWLPQALQARREVLRRGHSRLQQQIERLTEAYLAGVLSLQEYRRRRPDLERAQQALDAQAEPLEAQVDRQTEIKRFGLSLDDFCRRARDGLEQATWEQNRQLVEWLVARVVVTNGEVAIRSVIPHFGQASQTLLSIVVRLSRPPSAG